MAGFVIIVNFRLKPGARATFRQLVEDNARASARAEPGCRRFDVLEPAGEPDIVTLYEIYDDRAAFDAHVRSAHFASFHAASGDLIAEKSVTEYDLVCEGSGNQAV